jgi:hypothetical protein
MRTEALGSVLESGIRFLQLLVGFVYGFDANQV